MMRLCLLVLLIMSMISCDNDEREVLTTADIEAEIIEMNWYSTVKDLYVPEVLERESAPGNPQPEQRTGYRQDGTGNRIP